MKAILWALFGSVCMCGQSNADNHPNISRLVESADVIVVAKYREPVMWYTSELVVLTGSGEARIEKVILGDQPPGKKIRFQVVRFEEPGFEEPELPNAAGGSFEFPKTPAAPTKIEAAPFSSDLDKLPDSILFLKKSADGTLCAEDGLLFALPYSSVLEHVVEGKLREKAEKHSGGKSPEVVQPKH